MFKARKIAQDTRTLSFDAAAAVDRHLAFIARKCSWAEIERQVERARAENDPAEAERRRIAAAEKRCVEVHYRGITPDGMVPITGYAALADALAFDQFLTATAATLDPAVPLDVRRSMALGMLAGGKRAPKELVLYAHARPDQAMVEVENTRTVITPDQVREWCQRGRHPRDRPAHPRPGRAAHHRPPRPDPDHAGTGLGPVPRVRLPGLRTTIPWLRPRPPRALPDRRDHDLEPVPRSVEDTTGSRPPAAGGTCPSTTTPSCGSHPWARSTDDISADPHPAGTAGGATITRDRVQRLIGVGGLARSARTLRWIGLLSTRGPTAGSR